MELINRLKEESDINMRKKHADKHLLEYNIY